MDSGKHDGRLRWGRRWVIFLTLGLTVALLQVEGKAFFFTTFPNGAVAFWPDAQATLNLRLGCPEAGPLPNWGPCWDDAALDAANHWNGAAVRFRFSRQTPSLAADPCANSDGINTAAFTTTMCHGVAFGSALAVTMVLARNDGSLIDADTLFDANRTWSTYPGPLRRNNTGAVTAYDFHRVAIHEFGHTLGLDHPDAHGQVVAALMNSHISDLDDLQPDDIAGVNALYPTDTSGDALLEDPQAGNTVSGIGIIRGWACTAERIDLQIDGTLFQAAYPTVREDTHDLCGDDNNGFSLLINWNRLGPGFHTVVALRNGSEEIGRAAVTVVTLGQEFLRGASGIYRLPNFPTQGHDITIEWRESLQNFVIIEPN